VIFARQGKKERAEEEFRRVLLKNPEDAAARFYVSQ
jgi:Flp pilus assembly protein TadD